MCEREAEINEIAERRKGVGEREVVEVGGGGEGGREKEKKERRRRRTMGCVEEEEERRRREEEIEEKTAEGEIISVRHACKRDDSARERRETVVAAGVKVDGVEVVGEEVERRIVVEVAVAVTEGGVEVDGVEAAGEEGERRVQGEAVVGEVVVVVAESR